jgi:hypothetical protein
MSTPVPVSKIAELNFTHKIDAKDVQDLKASERLRRMIFVTYEREFKEMLFPSTNPRKLARVNLKEIYISNLKIRRIINLFIRDADDYVEELVYTFHDIRRKKMKEDRRELVRDLKREHIR